MTEKPKPWKVETRTPVKEYAFDYAYGMSATCPDCKRVVFIPGDELEDAEEYDYCPYCGKRRYEDERE